MVDTSLERFFNARVGPKEPLYGFKWAIDSDTLPLGLDSTYMEEISLPFPSIAIADPLFGGATYSNFPGFCKIDNVSATFYEDQLMSTTKWILEWMGRIRDFKDGFYFLPHNYKYDIPLVLQNTMGETISKIMLKNVWPSQRDNWDLNYTATNRLTVHVTFALDDFILS